MTVEKMLWCEKNGLRVTESHARRLQYIAADGDNRIAIAGLKGITLLNEEQVKAIVAELLDVYVCQVK